ISYDFGLKLERIVSRWPDTQEPDVFLALFDCLIIHDYDTSKTYFTGDEKRVGEMRDKIILALETHYRHHQPADLVSFRCNLSRQEYVSTIETIKELIRSGDTYQTNLTQQLTVNLPEETSAQTVFWNLREAHPAPFSAFISRKNSIVVSASPERFFR